jgi:rod shape-determining protein MreC
MIAAGKIGDQQRRITKYFDLENDVKRLEAENAQLHTQLLNRELMQIVLPDTFYTVRLDTFKHANARPSMRVIPATILTNSVHGANNWIVLNRGKKDGVTPNSGVMAKDGIVGIVRYVSDNYCVVMSVLHQQSKISASLRGSLGSLIWRGNDPTVMTLEDIPKDVVPILGDSVTTSGASIMFPSKHLLGLVVDSHLPDGSNFFRVQVKLTHNMSESGTVYIIENQFKSEIDSLVAKTRQ